MEWFGNTKIILTNKSVKNEINTLELLKKPHEKSSYLLVFFPEPDSL